MDSWRIGFPLMLLALVGCRAARLTEPLERENRHLEDALYHLQDELCEAQAQLDSCRRENAALRRQLESLGSTAGLEDLGAPPVGSSTRILSEGRREAATEMHRDSAPPFQSPPLIAPPNPQLPEGMLPGGASGEPTPADAHASDGVPAHAGTAVSGVSTPKSDYTVSEITLNQQLTGGHDRDNRPGDDGVMVVIEPRNRARQIINVPGEVSVVVLDPAKEGAAARVARWDFTPDEAAAHFKKTAFGEGIHLALPWPGEPPENSDLMLFVRLTLAEGQQFIADKPIRIKPSASGGPEAEEPRDRFFEQTASGDDAWRASTRSVPPSQILETESVPLQEERRNPVRLSRRPARWSPTR
jgi:hypothetical protein